MFCSVHGRGHWDSIKNNNDNKTWMNMKKQVIDFFINNIFKFQDFFIPNFV